MSLKRLNSLLLTAVLSGVLATGMAIPTNHVAWADDAAEGGVTTFVDTWQIVGDTLNFAVGGTSCTLRADKPTNSANKVYGLGSVSCTKKFPLLTLQVCIQARQAFVSEETTWQDIGCAATKKALNSSYLDDTASAQCIPGPAYYRTVTTAEGFNSEGEKVMGGFIKSGKVLFNCAVT